MPRYLLTIQYLGTRYAGWQTQSNATGVQQIVEAAFSTMAGGDRVVVESSGRTDSGVHARGQRAHLDLPMDMPELGLIRGANNLLPPDIRIIAAARVDSDFHARFAAKRKTYVYQIWNAPYCDVFHHETFAHVGGPLDEQVMNDAAQALVGKHDFKRFTVTEPEVRSTWRSIFSATVARREERVYITITGDGFLRFMVRRIAGSLIEIGRGKLAPAELARSLEPEYGIARWTAAPQGLVLESVNYDVEPPAEEKSPMLNSVV